MGTELGGKIPKEILVIGFRKKPVAQELAEKLETVKCPYNPLLLKVKYQPCAQTFSQREYR